MKTHFITKILVCVAFFTISIKAFSQFSGGTGTENDPYIITTSSQLAQLATYVNNNTDPYANANVHYKLGNDIDLSNYQTGEGWVIIGTYENYTNNRPFKGVFDGNNKMITNLYINTTLTARCAVGLFAISTGIIKNLSVTVNVNSHITSNNASTYIGGVVGRNRGNVLNCYTTGTVTTSATFCHAGGIAGSNEGGISNCYSTCSVSSTAQLRAFSGGIVGWGASGNLNNCYSTGNIYASGIDGSFSGGIVGDNEATIFNCYSTGSVNSSSSYYARSGGLSGRNSGNISNCFSKGNISSSSTAAGTGNSYSGGLVGVNNGGSIENCYSICAINSTVSLWAHSGGLVGENSNNGIISNCAALNPSISCLAPNTYYGRVVANNLSGGTLNGNIAFIGMINPNGVSNWFNIGHNQKDGANITAKEINSEGTIGNRFTNVEGWITDFCKLPGLFNEIVEMPTHLIASFTLYLSVDPLATGTIEGNNEGDYLCGTNITLTAKPNTGFSFVNWTENNLEVSNEATYSFPIHRDVSLQANFENSSSTYYTINASVYSGNGTITPEGDVIVEEGNSQTFTIEPNDGYHIDQVLIDGENNPEAVANGSYTFTNVTENHTIKVYFTTNQFTITASVEAGNGIISPSGTTNVPYGGNQEYLIVPATGYHIFEVLIDGANNPEAVENGSYTFVNITENHTIEAFFAINTYIIAASVGSGNGTISPSGNITVNHGDDQTFTFSSQEIYYIEQVLVDGVNIPEAISDGSYTFENITDNHNIVVIFEINSYTVSLYANPSEGGNVTGGGLFEHGEVAIVEALPNTDYIFLYWTYINDSNTDNPYSFQVTKNITLTANFKKDAKFNVAIVVNPENAGNVTGAGLYNQDDEVTVTASTNEGYDFVSWTKDGNIVSTETVYSFYIDEHIILTANFKLKTYTITASVVGSGYIDPSGIIIVNHGDNQKFTFVPDQGFRIAQILVDDDVIPIETTNGSYTFNNVISNHTINILFIGTDSYFVTLFVIPPEGGTVIGMGQYGINENVTVEAFPNLCYEFINWKNEAGIVVSTNNVYSFNVTEDITLFANFRFIKSYRVLKLQVQPK